MAQLGTASPSVPIPIAIFELFTAQSLNLDNSGVRTYYERMGVGKAKLRIDGLHQAKFSNGRDQGQKLSRQPVKSRALCRIVRSTYRIVR